MPARFTASPQAAQPVFMISVISAGVVPVANRPMSSRRSLPVNFSDVTAISAMRSYWVFDRQWVGGIALASLGFSWLVAAGWTALAERGDARARLLRLPVLIVVAVVAANAVLALTARWAAAADDARYWRDLAAARAEAAEEDAAAAAAAASSRAGKNKSTKNDDDDE